MACAHAIKIGSENIASATASHKPMRNCVYNPTRRRKPSVVDSEVACAENANATSKVYVAFCVCLFKRGAPSHLFLHFRRRYCDVRGKGEVTLYGV